MVQRHILHYLRQCGATYWKAVPSEVIGAALNLYPSYVREQARGLVTRGLLGVRQGRRGGYYPVVPPSASARPEEPTGPLLSEAELRRFIEHYLGVWRRYGVAVALIGLRSPTWPEVLRRHGPRVVRELLEEAAARVRPVLRAVDLVGQQGNDGLVIMLPHTDREAAARVRVRLVDHLAQASLPAASALAVPAEFVGSLASVPEDGDEPETLLQAIRTVS